MAKYDKLILFQFNRIHRSKASTDEVINLSLSLKDITVSDIRESDQHEACKKLNEELGKGGKKLLVGHLSDLPDLSKNPAVTAETTSCVTFTTQDSVSTKLATLPVFGAVYFLSHSKLKEYIKDILQNGPEIIETKEAWALVALIELVSPLLMLKGAGARGFDVSKLKAYAKAQIENRWKDTKADDIKKWMAQVAAATTLYSGRINAGQSAYLNEFISCLQRGDLAGAIEWMVTNPGRVRALAGRYL